MFFSAFFLCQYSDISFKTEAFNDFFNVKTADQALLTDGKLNVTFKDKIKLMTGCYKDKRIQRFYEQGDIKFDNELDLMHILKLLKKLEKLVSDPSKV